MRLSEKQKQKQFFFKKCGIKIVKRKEVKKGEETEGGREEGGGEGRGKGGMEGEGRLQWHAHYNYICSSWEAKVGVA